MDGKCGQHEVDNLAALAQLKGDAQIRNALYRRGALNDEISFGTEYVQPNTQATGQVTSFTMSQTVTVQSLA